MASSKQHGSDNMGTYTAHARYRRNEMRQLLPELAHELNHNPPSLRRPGHCPLCGHTGNRHPITGYCMSLRTCMKRRAELDEETIEFLGLV